MIDTDKYEGHTEGPWKLDDRVWEMYLGLETDVVLMQDAPLLLEEVKRLREVIDKEHPTFDWSSRQTIAKLDAEVKRLREDNELYLACINASHFRDKPGSALSKLTQMRFLQRGEEE